MTIFENRYRYLLIPALAVYSYLNTLFSEVYFYYKIDISWYYVLSAFLIITFFVWEGNRIAIRLLSKHFDSRNIRFLGLIFLTGMLFSALVSLLISFGIGTWILHLSAEALRMPARLALTYGTRINLFMNIINAVFFYIRQYNDKRLEAEELKRISTQAQLQAIRNQVNPHFLFNNLNVLSSLVMQESPEANKFIEEFSTVYRYVLKSQDEELVLLSVELDFILPYIFLLQKRFPESIFIDIQADQRFLSWFIIPLSVQMLIENAIKHNVASVIRPLHIQIFVEEDQLVISNNLQPKMTEEVSTQLGLNNIAGRYEMTTGKRIQVKKTDQQFSVRLPLIQQIL